MSHYNHWVDKHLLEEQNIFMPKTLNIGNNHHRWITSIALNAKKHDGFLVNIGHESKDSQIVAVNKKLSEFKNECERSEHNSKWIISCEHLQSELQTKEEIIGLKKILDEYFGKITIILYIRDPLATTISLWSTQIRYGAKLGGIPIPKHPLYEKVSNHKKTIENWESVFLRENIIVSRFQKKDFINNDLINDFCHKSGITFSEKFKMPNVTNMSLSLLGMKCLGYINNYVPHFTETNNSNMPLTLNKKRANITQYIEHFTSKSPKYLPSKGELAKYRDYYKDSDEWVLKNFFQEDKTLWEQTFKEISPNNKGIMKLKNSEQMILNIVIKLWKERSENEFQFKENNITL